jgi:hypothetical protein
VDNSLLVGPIYKFSLAILPALKNSDFYKELKEKHLILTEPGELRNGQP